jgi:hypothetical protein
MWDLPFESRFLYLDELSFFKPKRMTVSLCKEGKGGQKHHNSHVLITAADRGTIVLYRVMLFEWVEKVCVIRYNRFDILPGGHIADYPTDDEDDPNHGNEHVIFYWDTKPDWLITAMNALQEL